VTGARGAGHGARGPDAGARGAGARPAGAGAPDAGTRAAGARPTASAAGPGGRRPVDLLVRGGTVATMDARRRLVADGAVAIDGATIVAVGKAAELEAAWAAREVIDLRDHLITPGLVDAHNHPVHYASKGLADDLEYAERSHRHIWPYESGLDQEEAYWNGLATFAEGLRTGTTTFAAPGDLFPFAHARAAEELGVRACLARMAWDLHDPGAPPGSEDTTETALARGEEVVLGLRGRANGRLRGWFSLVRTWHVSDELCRRTKARADALGVGIHGHLNTMPYEVEQGLRRWGMRSLARYETLGLLGPNLYLVHMGLTTAEEIPLLRRHDVKVVHCPSASMLGGFGCVARGTIPEMVAAGVTVALGTDAAAISRFLDMVRVMYLAACAHKDVRADPTVMGPHKAFEMATIDGARALGWEAEIGSLEPGKRADLVSFATDELAWHPNPLGNPIANLVLSASGASCRTAIVDGRVLVRDGRLLTVDEAALRAEMGRRQRAIFARLGLALAPRWPVE
jgi:5-methylthioadenosine/S-adenosylhomocysteine deaminase